MPRIPEISGPRVQRQPIRVVPEQGFTAEQSGAAVGRGLQQLGSSAFRTAVNVERQQDADEKIRENLFNRAKQEQDILVTNDALLKAQGSLQDFLNGRDGKPGLLLREGAQASGIADEAQQQMTDIRSEFTEDLSPQQREMFSQEWEPSALRTMERVSLREVKQLAQARNFQSQQMLVRDSREVVIDRADPALVQKHLDGVKRHVNALNPGVGQAALEIIQKDATTVPLAAATRTLLHEQDEFGRRNYQGAEDFMQQNMHDMHFEDRREIASEIDKVRDFEIADNMFDYVQEMAPHFGFDELMDTFESITADPQQLDYLRKWSKGISVEKHQRGWEAFLRVVEPSSDPAADARAAGSLDTTELRADAAALVARKYKLDPAELARQQQFASADHFKKLTNFTYEQVRLSSPEWQKIEESVVSRALESGADDGEVERQVERAWQEFKRRGDPATEEEINRRVLEVTDDPAHQKNMRSMWTARNSDQQKAREGERGRQQAAIDRTMVGLDATASADFVSTLEGDNRVYAEKKQVEYHGPRFVNPIVEGDVLNQVMQGIENGDFGQPPNRKLVAAAANQLSRDSQDFLDEFMRKPAGFPASMLQAAVKNLQVDISESKVPKLYEAAQRILGNQKDVKQQELEKVVGDLYLEQNLGFWSGGRTSIGEALVDDKIKDPYEPRQYFPFVETTEKEEQLYRQQILDRDPGISPDSITPEMLKLEELRTKNLVPGLAAAERRKQIEAAEELSARVNTIPNDITPAPTPPVDQLAQTGQRAAFAPMSPREVDVRKQLASFNAYFGPDYTLLELEQQLESYTTPWYSRLLGLFDPVEPAAGEFNGLLMEPPVPQRIEGFRDTSGVDPFGRSD